MTARSTIMVFTEIDGESKPDEDSFGGSDRNLIRNIGASSDADRPGNVGTMVYNQQ